MSEADQIKNLLDFAEKQASLMDKVVNTLDNLDRRVKILENERA